MGKAENRLKIRRTALARLDDVMNGTASVYTVHYSCESFYDQSNPKSRRITSIAAEGRRGQSRSFSIHHIAERQGIDFQNISAHYDQLEKIMLDEFYKFINQHTDSYWITWNMVNTFFGFPAIAHRYSVLGGAPINIDDEKLINLSSLLQDIYGYAYIGHPRLERVAEKNQITLKDFLPGKEEAAAFEQGRFPEMHQSTLRKVAVLWHLANRTWQRTLMTDAKRFEQYGTGILGWHEQFIENSYGKAFLTFLALLGVIQVFQLLFLLF